MNGVLVAEMHTHCFRFRELESVFVRPCLYAIYTALEMTFNSNNTFRAKTDHSHFLLERILEARANATISQKFTYELGHTATKSSVMQIAQYAVLPRGVVRLFLVEED